MSLVGWAPLLVLLLGSALPASAAGPTWDAYRRDGIQARDRGRYVEAERMLLAAVAAAETGVSPDERLVQSLIDLARLYVRLHKYAQAEPLVRRAGEIEEDLRGPQHPAVARVLSLHALLLRELGREADLRDVESRLRAILARPSVRGPSTRWAKAGATDEALDADEQACAREAEYGTTQYGPLIDPDGFTRCIENQGWRPRGRLVGAD